MMIFSTVEQVHLYDNTIIPQDVKDTILKCESDYMTRMSKVCLNIESTDEELNSTKSETDINRILSQALGLNVQYKLRRLHLYRSPVTCIFTVSVDCKSTADVDTLRDNLCQYNGGGHIDTETVGGLIRHKTIMKKQLGMIILARKEEICEQDFLKWSECYYTQVDAYASMDDYVVIINYDLAWPYTKQLRHFGVMAYVSDRLGMPIHNDTAKQSAWQLTRSTIIEKYGRSWSLSYDSNDVVIINDEHISQ